MQLGSELQPGSDPSAHQNSAVDPRRKIFSLGTGCRKSLPLAGGAPGRRVFSLLLTLAALGMIHQTLCEPGFKAGKGRFFWHLTEMTPKSREVGLAGWREEKSK